MRARSNQPAAELCSPSPEGEGRDEGGCLRQHQSLLKQSHVGHLPHFQISALLVSAFALDFSMSPTICADTEAFPLSVLLCLQKRINNNSIVEK